MARMRHGAAVAIAATHGLNRWQRAALERIAAAGHGFAIDPDEATVAWIGPLSIRSVVVAFPCVDGFAPEGRWVPPRTLAFHLGCRGRILWYPPGMGGGLTGRRAIVKAWGSIL